MRKIEVIAERKVGKYLVELLAWRQHYKVRVRRLDYLVSPFMVGTIYYSLDKATSEYLHLNLVRLQAGKGYLSF